MGLKRDKISTIIGHQRRNLPRDGALVAALDIGAAKTVCFIARVVSAGNGMIDCDIIGAGHFGSQLPTGGADHQSFAHRERAIRCAVETAEQMAGERIHEIHIAVPGRALRCRRVAVELEIAGGFVTADDVVDSLIEGSKLINPEGDQTLHTVPIGYRLDGEDMGPDPRGFRCSVLTTQMLGVSASENVISNLTALIEASGLKAASFIAAPMAAADTILVDDEKELGVLTIDIGSDGLAYGVHRDGRLTACGGCAPGARHISRDIAQIFSTPIDHAERQKILHGTVLASSSDDHRFVDFVPIANEGAGAGLGQGQGASDKHCVSRAEMAAVITARMEEIYETLLDKIIQEQGSINPLRRVVLTGGGSQLEGVREHAEKIFGMKARLGRPATIEGAPEALCGPAFSVCAGTLHHAASRFGHSQLYPEVSDAASHQGPIGQRVGQGSGLGGRRRATGTLGAIGSWWKERF